MSAPGLVPCTRSLQGNFFVYVSQCSTCPSLLLVQVQLTAEDRQLGKRVNFSVLYGGGVRQLATEIGVSQKEAQRFLDR